MGRTRFLISRTFQSILVLVIVTLITFAIFSLWPSNPALLVCGKPCTAENLARAQAYMGLDEPWVCPVLAVPVRDLHRPHFR